MSIIFFLQTLTIDFSEFDAKIGTLGAELKVPKYMLFEDFNVRCRGAFEMCENCQPPQK